MEEIIKELKQLSESLYDEHQYTWSDQVDEIIEKLRAKTAEAVGHDLLVSGEFAEENEKLIKWFMELAVIMKEDGYTLESLLSIDVSAWIEMFQQHGATPQNAYLEDMSNA